MHGERRKLIILPHGPRRENERERERESIEGEIITVASEAADICCSSFAHRKMDAMRKQISGEEEDGKPVR